MSRPSKHVVLKYHTKDRDVPASSTSSATALSVSSSGESSVSSSPLAPSPKAAGAEDSLTFPHDASAHALDVHVAPALGFIDELYGYSLDEEDEWRDTASKVLVLLEPLQARWRELEATRKSLARSAAATARVNSRANTSPPKVAKRRPGRPPGWRKRPQPASETSSGNDGS